MRTVKIVAMTLGALATAIAATALAGDEAEPFDPGPGWEHPREVWHNGGYYCGDQYRGREEHAPGYGWRDEGDWGQRQPMECWNPHAGHFESVRPGEYQNDLDFSRCRPLGEGYYYYGAPRYGGR